VLQESHYLCATVTPLMRHSHTSLMRLQSHYLCDTVTLISYAPQSLHLCATVINSHLCATVTTIYYSPQSHYLSATVITYAPQSHYLCAIKSHYLCDTIQSHYLCATVTSTYATQSHYFMHHSHTNTCDNTLTYATQSHYLCTTVTHLCYTVTPILMRHTVTPTYAPQSICATTKPLMRHSHHLCAIVTLLMPQSHHDAPQSHYFLATQSIHLCGHKVHTTYAPLKSHYAIEHISLMRHSQYSLMCHRHHLCYNSHTTYAPQSHLFLCLCSTVTLLCATAVTLLMRHKVNTT
jgi:hypothetical protein